jgi:hypothetical protein
LAYLEKDEDGNEILAKPSYSMPQKKRKSYDPWGIKAVAVTSDDYVQKREDQVPVDEQYLYRYGLIFKNNSVSFESKFNFFPDS